MRRLIACSDGTWKTAESTKPTNVVILAQALTPQGADGVPQALFYDPGVGTGSFLDRMSGGAFGRGLSENIKDIYRWLVHSYAPGDEIFLFGFSRGAYTVRSAVGLIRKCGLLLPEHSDRLDEAYELYRRSDASADPAEAVAFRSTYSRAVEIALLGVWDTVGTLGIPLVGLRALTRRRYRFHDTELTGIVRRAYHAVAIDERRRAFEAALWTSPPQRGQEIEQVWFAGAHGDVGGGYDQRGLSDIALAWMLDKARRAGLTLDEQYLRARLKPDETGKLHSSLTGIYLALGWQTRTMGERGTEEFLHVTPLVRHALPPMKYSPKTLMRYLEAGRVAVNVDPESLAAGWLAKLPEPFITLAASRRARSFDREA
jgi:uncharacterized protein (DUF2235 family)